MGAFVDVSFPSSIGAYPNGMMGEIVMPRPSIASTPDGKIEQRILTASEGRYELRLPNADNLSWYRVRELYEFYLGVGGWANSFRYRDPRDYWNSVAGQALGTGDGATTDFQLVRTFQTAGSAISYSHTITKPAAGTVIPYIAGVKEANRFSIDLLTGILSLSADGSNSVTAATSAAQCKLTTPNNLVAGSCVYLTGFTAPWDALNGNRYSVAAATATDFTVDADTSAIAAYSANGGTWHTLPQAGEAVTADFTFDWQVRFDADIGAQHLALEQIVRIGALKLLEVRE